MLLVYPESKFPLGLLSATRRLLEQVSHEDVGVALFRHAVGDWGDLSEEDRATNDAALRDGGRLLSAYTSSVGVQFWIITEADRSATTILLPDDY